MIKALVHALALTARTGPPIRDGALVEPKRRHNGLHGTPMSEQGHDEDRGLCRGAQPIEDRACGGAEGFVALVADEPLLLPCMDADIAHASLASGMAVPIGADYSRGIHDAPPGCAWKCAKRSMSGSPFSLQVSFTTVRWGATCHGSI